MRQAQKKKEKDKIAIVLLLSFCVIALTSIFAVKANIDKINQHAPDMPVLEETQTQQSKEETKNTNTATNTTRNPEAEVSSNIPTIDSKNSKTNYDYIFPLDHEESHITNPYSMDKLIYSVTLDQYMTHCGIDIEAPEDTQVLSIAEGTVTAIYNDDRYGTTIEITHPQKVVSIYSNLSTSEMVEIGDVVTQGQIIGGVGSTGLFESLEPAHLHFEMIQDGSYVNPNKFIRF